MGMQKPADMFDRDREWELLGRFIGDDRQGASLGIAPDGSVDWDAAAQQGRRTGDEPGCVLESGGSHGGGGSGAVRY
jgi:hypothetical protein